MRTAHAPSDARAAVSVVSGRSTRALVCMDWQKAQFVSFVIEESERFQFRFRVIEETWHPLCMVGSLQYISVWWPCSFSDTRGMQSHSPRYRTESSSNSGRKKTQSVAPCILQGPLGAKTKMIYSLKKRKDSRLNFVPPLCGQVENDGKHWSMTYGTINQEWASLRKDFFVYRSNAWRNQNQFPRSERIRLTTQEYFSSLCLLSI